MDGVEATFEKVFGRFGRPTRRIELSEGVQSIYNFGENFADVYCNTVESEQINALASIYNGTELIAIFQGLLNHISPVYVSMLCDPEMFPHIGDPGIERHEICRFGMEHWCEHQTIGLGPLPKDKVRLAVSKYLIYAAILFIHSHEYTHIVAGHLDLLKDEFGIDTYDELPIYEMSEEEASIRRALELQADNGAALTSLHFFRKRVTNDPHFDQTISADVLWAIAVDVLFVLFNRQARLRRAGKSMTHPAPLVRWISVRVAVTDRPEEFGVSPLLQGPNGSQLRAIRDWFHRFNVSDVDIGLGAIDRREAVDELISTWQNLAPHKRSLERYRANRGDRVKSSF